MKNKGGCEVGKKEEKGGCLKGKKAMPVKLNIIEKKPVVKKRVPKKLNIVETKKKPVVKKRVPKKLNIKPAKKKIEPKKKPVVKKRLPTKLNIKPVQKKKMVKKLPTKLNIIEKHPELMAITGLTTKKANAKTPLELFGMLPKEIGQMVLNPSQRGGGVKLTDPAIKEKAIDEFISEVREDHKQDGSVSRARQDTRTGYLGDAAENYKEKYEKSTKRKFGTLFRKTVGRPIKVTGRSVNSLNMVSIVKILLNSAKVPLPEVKKIYSDYKYEMERYDF